ncbi:MULTISPECIES: SdpI family protein [unclassified Paenibacillus]|uniref:SdpI family protein n=2 Tax=unclassified Paenibacillus TaxID=185978 RepID=UPI001F2BE3E2|nr:SdpI family protein [Paenibacillus sp. JJ-223]CAH1222832.1 hypothetical protein PAECIP111890_05425 [Paenibacillus sp. JJ-223]
MGGIIGIIVGVCFFVMGLMLYKKPPKQINGIYGYRTPRSMSDLELWHEAQRYSSNLMMQFGVIMAAFGVLGFWFTDMQALVLSLGAIIFYTVRMFMKVEGRLKEMQQSNKK